MAAEWMLATCETCNLPIHVNFDDEGEIAEAKSICAEPKPDSCPSVLAQRLLAEQQDESAEQATALDEAERDRRGREDAQVKAEGLQTPPRGRDDR